MIAHTVRPIGSAAVLFVAAAAAGCGGRYDVTGRVLYEDGSPVPAGTVLAEATVDGKLFALQGNIEPDGSFTLGGMKPGDGALPGKYRAAVMPVALGDSERAAGKTPAVDGKFGQFETSGLSFEVRPEKNVITLRVAKPKPRGG
jgi:hypothetical protein